MGIYIKGMKMPQTCEECPCWWVDGEGYIQSCCQAGSEYEKEPCDHNKQDILPNDCPLAEVPEPHGRLIDADIIVNEMNDMHVEGEVFTTAVAYVKLIVEHALTVIEAEGE